MNSGTAARPERLARRFPPMCGISRVEELELASIGGCASRARVSPSSKLRDSFFVKRRERHDLFRRLGEISVRKIAARRERAEQRGDDHLLELGSREVLEGFGDLGERVALRVPSAARQVNRE